MCTLRTILSNQGCPEIPKTMVILLPVAMPYLASLRPQKQGNLKLCLFPQISRSFTSDLQGTLSRVFVAETRKSTGFPKNAVYNSCDERALMAPNRHCLSSSL